MEERFRRALKWTEGRTGGFYKGNRNNFITRLAGCCHGFGVDESWLRDTLIRYYTDKDFTASDIVSCIRSVYKNRKPPLKEWKLSKDGTSRAISNKQNLSPEESLNKTDERIQISTNEFNHKTLIEMRYKYKKEKSISVYETLKKNISITSNAFEKDTLTVTAIDVLNDIKNGKYFDKIKFLRGLPAEEYSKEKLKLPAVTFSGMFSRVEDSKLIEPTGLYCLDIDKLESKRFVELFDQLKTDPYTMALWISPSGNGLKVLITIPVPKNADIHSRYFDPIEAYYKETYNVELDKKCRNISRLCFVSSDSEMIINETCYLFDPVSEEKQNTQETSTQTTRKLIDYIKSLKAIKKLESLKKVDNCPDYDHRIKYHKNIVLTLDPEIDRLCMV